MMSSVCSLSVQVKVLCIRISSLIVAKMFCLSMDMFYELNFMLPCFNQKTMVCTLQEDELNICYSTKFEKKIQSQYHLSN